MTQVQLPDILTLFGIIMLMVVMMMCRTDSARHRLVARDDSNDVDEGGDDDECDGDGGHDDVPYRLRVTQFHLPAILLHVIILSKKWCEIKPFCFCVKYALNINVRYFKTFRR